MFEKDSKASNKLYVVWHGSLYRNAPTSELQIYVSTCEDLHTFLLCFVLFSRAKTRNVTWRNYLLSETIDLSVA